MSKHNKIRKNKSHSARPSRKKKYELDAIIDDFMVIADKPEVKSKHNKFTKITNYPARPSNKEKYEAGDIIGNFIVIADKPGGVEPGAIVVSLADIYGEDAEKKRKWLISNPKEAKLVGNKYYSMFQNKQRQHLPEVYLIKQDYTEDTKVAPPHARLAQTNAIKTLPAALRKPATTLYAYTRKTSRNEENLNVMLEVIGNSIAIDYGMPAQQQSLIFASYGDKHPKVVSISKWEYNLEPLEGRLAGSETRSAYHNYIVQVKKYKNGNIIKDKDGNPQFVKDKNGRYLIDNSIKNLGWDYAIALLMEDRDYFGSRLQNKGIQNNNLFGFDFGHAFRENVLLDTLQDDFTFANPSAARAFKNISVFSDTTSAEKMKGMYLIYLGLSNETRDQLFSEAHQKAIDSRIKRCMLNREFAQRAIRVKADVINTNFDEMIKLCEDKSKDKLLSKTERDTYAQYAQDLVTYKQNALNNETKLMTIFREKLHLSPRELDLLDTLDKVFAPALTNLSPDGKVVLQHLRIATPGPKLCKWKVVPSKRGTVKLMGDLSGKLSREQLLAFKCLIRRYTENSAGVILERSDKNILLTMPNAAYEKLLDNFTEAALLGFRGDKPRAARHSITIPQSYFTATSIDVAESKNHTKWKRASTGTTPHMTRGNTRNYAKVKNDHITEKNAKTSFISQGNIADTARFFSYKPAVTTRNSNGFHQSPQLKG